MNITVSGRHVDMTPGLKEFAHEHAERLFKYFDMITSIDVVLSAESGRCSAEMVIQARKNLRVVGEVEDRDFNAAIGQLTDKMERKLTREKEKIKNHRGRKALGEVTLDAEAVEGDYDDDIDTEVDDEFDED